MSLSISIPKTAEQIPLDGLLTLARTAVGLGIGMLVADKIRRPIRQATAIALVSVGALAAVPLVVKAAAKRARIASTKWGDSSRVKGSAGCSIRALPFSKSDFGPPTKCTSNGEKFLPRARSPASGTSPVFPA